MFFDLKRLKAKNRFIRALTFTPFPLLLGLVLGIAASGRWAYAGEAASCASDADACPPSESTKWRPLDLAVFPIFGNFSAPATDEAVPTAESFDSNFESSHNSDGLTIHQGDEAWGMDFGTYQLTWHDAPMFARDSSGAVRLQSEFLQAEFDPFEKIHLDIAFGEVAQYLRSQSPIGSATASGTFGGNELALSFKRQMQTGSLRAIRKGISFEEMALTAKRKLFWGFKVGAELHRSAYSDHNSSNWLQFSPEYDFELLGADLGLGYRVQYAKWARPLNDGSYNPLFSLEQELFWHLAYEAKPVSFSLDLAGGRSMSQNTPTSPMTSDFSAEGSTTLGWNVNERFLVELTASGGNYGLNYPANGWMELSTGFRVKYSF